MLAPVLITIPLNTSAEYRELVFDIYDEGSSSWVNLVMSFKVREWVKALLASILLTTSASLNASFPRAMR